MRKFSMGLIVGMAIMASGYAFADEGLQKVEAYLRPSLPITLNGNPVTLESAPVMYDGSTYLKIRDVAKITGLNVNWNDSTQTVELGIAPSKGGASVTETTYGSDIIPADETPPVDEITPEQKAKKIQGINNLINSKTIQIERNQQLLIDFKDSKQTVKALEEAIQQDKDKIAELEKQKASLQP